MAFSNLISQIGTNYIPGEEELDHIKNSVLPEPTAKLTDLEIEINRVEEIYSSLTEQRQVLLAEIEGYHNLISPARRLPIDILQEIFLHTLPTTHNALMDSYDCPLLLTQICNGWRRIALSTPQLWSSIHIPVPPIARGHPHHWGPIHFGELPEEFRISTLSCLKSYATSITNWLGRSGVTPLSISLYDPRDSFVPKEHYEIIIDSFLPFTYRWKNLVLDTYSPFLTRIAALTESDVPFLESLTLHDITNNANDPNNPLPVWKSSGIVKSHRLTKINYTQLEDNIADFSFKWAQLTDIKLSQSSYDWGAPNANITLTDIITVLSLTPRVINFHSEIKLTHTDLASRSSMSLLPLLNLQKMVFHDGSADCRPLFDFINVPSLLHLEFFPINLSSITVLSTFLPQVSETILSLTTSYSFFVQPNHRPALSQCQKLSSITIKSAPSLGPTPWSPTPVDFIGDIFLNDLTLPTGHPDRLAPALEVFECQTGGNFSDAAVLKFIKAKQSRPDIAKLKRISIRFTRPKELDVLSDEEMLQYIADGLGVDVRYPVGLNPKVPFAFTPDAGVPLADNPYGWPTSSSNWGTWPMQ
jgi:hypothetical protein